MSTDRWNELMAGRAPWEFEVSARRIALSHAAACDITDLVAEIGKRLAHTDDAVGRALALRAEQLAGLVASALGDKDEDEAGLYHDFYNEPLPGSQAAREGDHG